MTEPPATPPEQAADVAEHDPQPEVEPAPSCEFCGWIDYDGGWVHIRPGDPTVGVPGDPGRTDTPLCGFCDISQTVEAWLHGSRGKPPAIIDQMRSFNLLRVDMVRLVRQLATPPNNTPESPVDNGGECGRG